MTAGLLTIEERLARIEDRDALVRLKHQYCRHCDNDYDGAAIAALFLENGTWDAGPMGKAETRDGIRAYFEASSKSVRMAIHHVTNPLIDLDGDRALCRWYLWQPMVFRETEEALWYAATYEDVCRRQKNLWFFESMTIKTRLFSPYSDGFAKTPIIDVRSVSQNPITKPSAPDGHR